MLLNSHPFPVLLHALDQRERWLGAEELQRNPADARSNARLDHATEEAQVRGSEARVCELPVRRPCRGGKKYTHMKFDSVIHFVLDYTRNS